MFETNIIALHNQIPHISLPSPSFLPSRPRSSRHRSALFYLSLSLFLSLSETTKPPYSEEKGSWNKIFTSARALFTKTRGASLPIISRADVPSASLLLSSFFFFGL
jgi:hypothetical protein